MATAVIVQVPEGAVVVPVPAVPVEVPALPDGAPAKLDEPLKPLELVPPVDVDPPKPVLVLPEALLVEPENPVDEPPVLNEPPEEVDELPLEPSPLRGGVPSDEALQAASAETDKASAETKMCDRISGLRKCARPKCPNGLRARTFGVAPSARCRLITSYRSDGVSTRNRALTPCAIEPTAPLAAIFRAQSPTAERAGH
ncbi:MAG TPA: hypothetical protein VGM44_21340 [Polyangiaceae bacterium]